MLTRNQVSLRRRINAKVGWLDQISWLQSRIFLNSMFQTSAYFIRFARRRPQGRQSLDKGQSLRNKRGIPFHFKEPKKTGGSLGGSFFKEINFCCERFTKSGTNRIRTRLISEGRSSQKSWLFQCMAVRLLTEVNASDLLTFVKICKHLAGDEGFEPSQTDPESVVLPLDESPGQRKL